MMPAAREVSAETTPPPNPSVARFTRRHLLILCAILALAASLRIYRLGAESFWIDELYMLQYTAGHCHAEFELPVNQVIDTPPRLTSLDNAVPVWKVQTTIREDQHPPLYYVLLRLWREAFGSTEVALRSLSVVASLAAIVLLFDLGRLLFSPGVALWACAIMAVAQAEIRYAQEARSYMLLTAFILAAADALLRIERNGFSARRAVALGASMLAIVLTHYFGIAGCVALGLYAVIRLRGKVRVRTVGVMVAAAVLYAVTWGPFFLQQMGGYAIQSDWINVDPTDTTSPLLGWTYRLLYAPIRFFAEPAFRHPGPLPMVVATLLFLPLLRLRRVPALLLPVLWMWTWFGLIAGLDLARSTRQMEFTRFLLGAAPALYLAIPALLWDRRGWMRHAIPAAFVIYCITSLPWTYDAPKGEWRKFGQDIGHDATPADLVLYYTASGKEWFSGVMYMAADHYSSHAHVPSVMMTGPLPPDTLARARSAHAVWMATDAGEPDIPALVPGFHIGGRSFAWGVGNVLRLLPDAAPPPPPATAPDAGTHTSSTPTTRGT